MKNWIFDDPLHKKGPVLVILMPGMIQPSGSGGNGNLETAEVFKALKNHYWGLKSSKFFDSIILLYIDVLKR